MSKLTDKQRLFIEEYLVDLNATQAAIRAGYSKRTAKEMGSENLAKPPIKQAIKRAQQERSKRCQITQDDVINGLLKEANRDEEGSSHGARVSAWIALGKHLAMFVERKEVSGKDGGPVTVAEIPATERLKALLDSYAEKTDKAN